MFGKKDINDYCNYVYDEMTDIRSKLDKIEQRAKDFSPDPDITGQIFGHLHELENEVDSKLVAITPYCPNRNVKGGTKTYAGAGAAPRA